MNRFFLLGFLFFFSACKDKAGQDQNEQKEFGKQQKIFPVTSFLAGQVHEVDSLKPRLIKYITIDNKTDSVPISPAEFKALANEFMQPDISDERFKDFYKETSFADQSVPSVTITYSTSNAELEVQRIDITIKPDPVESDKVENVYMEKLVKHNDSSILKKLLWKSGSHFQITTSKQTGSQSPSFTQLKVSWDPED